ncbi:class II glutamine amidotransferase [Pseudofrancisella aestuarii]|uniref:Class II glutamine amidotransferase n=1 Tax=Pseudofrancisella aestuarii TaxID=2670347 RepID=A0ABV9TAB8_9GAMM|nr:class II glutamine amidotransferase [Pseudofrancisella aestuarii]
MCRWLMYHGKSIIMSELLVDPENSLIHQSIASHEGVVNVNGDGFGLGWYTKLNKKPGVYKDPLPAWNNKNLASIASHIKSKNFLAHVRASTGTPSTTTNCHPFRYKNHLFMHNGAIFNFNEIRHDLEYLIDKKYFKHRYGCTDTEAMFLLALTNGLIEDPKTAINKTVEQIFKIQQQNNVPQAIKASIAYTDGNTSYAIKTSTINHQPSLYYVNYEDMLDSLGMERQGQKYKNSYVVLSEPLLKSESYKYVDNHTIIKISENEFTIEKL